MVEKEEIADTRHGDEPATRDPVVDQRRAADVRGSEAARQDERTVHASSGNALPPVVLIQLALLEEKCKIAERRLDQALEREALARGETEEFQLKAERMQAAVAAAESAQRSAEEACNQAVQRAEKLNSELQEVSEAFRQYKLRQSTEANRPLAEADVDAECVVPRDTVDNAMVTATNNTRSSTDDAATRMPAAASAPAAPVDPIEDSDDDNQLEPQLLNSDNTVQHEDGGAQPDAAQSQDAKPEHDSLLSLRMATDKPFIIHRKANIVATAVNQVPDRVWRKRREKRVAARLPAVLSKEGSSKTRSCIILDTSSGGARIQVEPDKLNHAIGQLFVGDTITLMFEMGQKQTSVTCLVVWVDGIYCGVKYSGQFSTKNVRSNKAGTNNSSQNTRRADNSKSTNRTLGRFFKSEDEVAQPSNSRP